MVENSKYEQGVLQAATSARGLFVRPRSRARVLTQVWLPCISARAVRQSEQ
jgi:hypothetical protein